MRFPLIFGLWAVSAIAYGADIPASKMRACAQVSTDAARLSCYDKLAAGLDTRQFTSAAPPAAGASTPAGSAANSATVGSSAGPAPTAGGTGAGTAAATAGSPTRAGSAAGAAATAVGPPREFGLPLPPPPPEQEIKAVTASVTATHHGSSGGVIIDLDNGQRWQQVGSGDMGLEVGDVVTISRALLGSFWLQPPGGRGSKVHRLK